MGEAKRRDEAAMDHPIEAEYRDAMQATLQVLDDLFNPVLKGDARTVGIALLVFPFRDEDGYGRCNFLSNEVDAKSLALLFDQMATRFEDRPDIPETTGRA